MKRTFTYCVLTALLFAGFYSGAQTLISQGANWKYLDDGSNQGTSWQAISYNDASWSSGNAELGYGDGDEATVIGYGPNASSKYPTTYFRYAFNVSNPASIPSLDLDLLCDDGAVVYLNGTELARENMPTGNISYTTYATTAAEYSFVSFNGLPSTALVSGTNVIAVEVHQGNASSSDLSFNLGLSAGVPPGTPTLERGPYLQKGTPNSIVIKWRTSSSTDSKVSYGTSVSSLSTSVTDATSTTEHEIEITGLSANTTYYYSIGNSTTTIAGGSSDYYFKTSPVAGTEQPVTAWILGDAGTATTAQRNVRDAYYNYIGANHTDMVIMLGDNAYNDGLDSEYQTAFFENMYENIIRQSVTWTTPGNHDYYGVDHLSNYQFLAPYYDIFTLPTAAEAGGVASGTEAYYSYDYGNIHFISLDSHEEDRSVNGSMYSWLQTDLASTTQKWIVVFWHHPPYTKGSHDSDTESRLIEMRQNFNPLLEQYGVDLILGGHSHSYERSNLINGHYGSSNTYNTSTMLVDGGDGKADVDGAYTKELTGPDAGKGAVYIVAGSSGKVSSMGGTHPIMETSLVQLGSVILEVDGDIMDVKFIDDSGSINDYFTIDKTPSGANVKPSVSISSPTQGASFSTGQTINLAANASDADGNVTQVEFFVDNVSVGTDATAPYTATFSSNTNGTYAVYAVATDDSTATSTSASVSFNVGVVSIHEEISIASGSDDVEEEANGTMYVTSTDLELVNDGTRGDQTIGMKFNGVNIPQGSTVTNAYIQFTTDEISSGVTNLSISGNNVDNASAFGASNFDISTRARTSATVNWSPAAWNTVGAATTNERTPDISAIVQEIVNRGGWSNGNDMVLILEGSGSRTAESYEGSVAQAPKLVIDYTNVAGNNPPTVSITSPADGSNFSIGQSFTISANAIDSDGSVSNVEFFVNGSSIGTDNTSPYSINYSNNNSGTYSISAVATDDDGDSQSSAPISVSIGVTTQSFQTSVATGNDDAEEGTSGAMYLTSSDLELVYDSYNSQGNQQVGMRFTNISIPQGATITNAYLQFTVDENANDNPSNLVIQGEDIDDATTFTTTSGDISNRSKTTASVNWSPNDWTSVGASGSDQQTPNISAVVQEVVNRTGWASGNDMVIILSGSGRRVAESYDGSAAGAPSIFIEYNTAPPNAAPNAAFTQNSTTGVAPHSVSFDASTSTDSDGSIVSYSWDFGDGNTGSGVNTSNNYTTAGNYTITLTVTDDDGATDQITSSVVISAPNVAPTAAFTNVSSGQAPVNISFDASTSSDPDGSIVSYSWDFGDGNSGTGLNTNHTYTSQGIYTVVLTVTDNDGATDQATGSVTITPPNVAPIASFNNNPNGGQAPINIGFDASASSDIDGTITTYAWDFGDGNSGSGVTASHTYTSGGNFNVTLTVTDNQGATDFSSSVVNITPPNVAPVSSFTASATSGQAPISISFDASGSSDSDGSIASYSWNFGDGNTGSGANPSHTYTTGGTFNVSLTVTDNQGATGVSSTSVNISSPNVAPTAVLSASTNSGVAPLSITFDGSGSTDNDGSVASYAWDFGDGSTSSLASPNHTYNSAGNYTVTLTVTDNQGATDQANTSISVAAQNVLPTASFNATPVLGTAPLLVSLDASASSDPDGSIVSYSWDFGDGSSGSGSTLNHTFSNSGTYVITLTVTDNFSGSDQATTSITVNNALPTASFSSNPGSGQAPISISFDASSSSDPDGSIASYSWNFGDGNSGSGVNPSHTYTTGGNFTVSLTVTDNEGGTDVTSNSIAIANPNIPPVASFSNNPNGGQAPISISFNASASSDADGTISSYSWDFGDGNTGSGVNPSHTYNSGGSFTIALTVTDNQGATDFTSSVINITPPNVAPVSSFTASATSGQAPIGISFDATASADSDGSIVSYSWNFGDGNTGSGVNPSHTYNSGGNFTVTLTVSDNQGATDFSTTTLNISNPNVAPTAAFTPSASSGQAPVNISFDASSSNDADGSITSYNWSFGDGNTGSGVNVNNTYTSGGIFTVSLTVTDNQGATDVSTTTLNIAAPDVTPPSVPSGLATSNITTSSIDLSWSASSDNVGVTGYNVYLNGIFQLSTGNTNHTFSGLSASTSYNLSVEAYDAAGNISSMSSVSETTDAIPVGPTLLFASYFESGWDNWIDGGRQCSRRSDANYAYEGIYSIRLKKDDGISSSMTSPTVNITSFSSVELDFYYYNRRSRNGDNFIVEFYNGSSWTTVATFYYNTDYFGNSFTNANVVLSSSSYNFSSQSKFRIQSIIGGRGEIYIDQVTLNGHSTNSIARGGQTQNNTVVVKNSNNSSASDKVLIPNNESDLLSEDETSSAMASELKLFPIPANEQLKIEVMAMENQSSKTLIYSMNGAIVLSETLDLKIGDNELQIETQTLTSGTYMIQMFVDGKTLNKKFIIQH